jgi:hypothetical protein
VGRLIRRASRRLGSSQLTADRNSREIKPFQLQKNFNPYRGGNQGAACCATTEPMWHLGRGAILARALTTALLSRHRD